MSVSYVPPQKGRPTPGPAQIQKVKLMSYSLFHQIVEKKILYLKSAIDPLA